LGTEKLIPHSKCLKTKAGDLATATLQTMLETMPEIHLYSLAGLWIGSTAELVGTDIVKHLLLPSALRWQPSHHHLSWCRVEVSRCIYHFNSHTDVASIATARKNDERKIPDTMIQRH